MLTQSNDAKWQSLDEFGDVSFPKLLVFSILILIYFIYIYISFNYYVQRYHFFAVLVKASGWLDRTTITRLDVFRRDGPRMPVLARPSP